METLIIIFEFCSLIQTLVCLCSDVFLIALNEEEYTFVFYYSYIFFEELTIT